MNTIKEITQEILSGTRVPSVDVTGIIKGNEELPYSNDATKSRLVIKIADVTGELSFSIFDGDYTQNQIDDWAVGNIVRFTDLGTGVYQKTTAQLKYLNASSYEILNREDIDVTKYVLDLAPEVVKLKALLDEQIDKVKDEQLNALCKWVIEKDWFKENFWKHPAAKANHHAQEKGLALHTINIMTKVDMPSLIDFNRDLVRTAALFHDLGKIWELDMQGDGSGQYTKASMFGHIVMGSFIVYDAYREGIIDSERFMLIGHMVLAHHGKLEYGSPVVPAFKESAFLHRFDQIDAEEYAFASHSLSLLPGEKSEKSIWHLGTAPYLPNLTSENSNSVRSEFSEAFVDSNIEAPVAETDDSSEDTKSLDIPNFVEGATANTTNINPFRTMVKK